MNCLYLNVSSLFKLLPVAVFAAVGCSKNQNSTNSKLMNRVGIENGVAIIGQAYDSRTENFLGQCVTSEKPDGQVQLMYSGAPTAKIEMSKITNWEDLHALLDVQVSGKLKYPSFNLSGAARFISDAKGTTSSYSMIYSAGIRGKNAVLKDPVLSKTALEVKATLDNEKIREMCGDQYISQVELGAQLLIQVRFDFANAQAKSEFDAKINFEYLNLFEVEGAATVLSENAKKNSSISVSVLQIGGEVEKMLRVLGSTPQPEGAKNYAILQCDIENSKACLESLSTMLDYASNPTTGFASQMQNLTYDINSPGGAAVLGYVSKRYENGSSSTRKLYEAPPPVLGAAIRDARDWLGEKYDYLAKDSRIAAALSRLYLTPEQRIKIEESSAKIANSTKKLLEVVGICYSNLDACGSAKAELEALLQTSEYSYDPNSLTKQYTFVDYCLSPGNSESATLTVEAIKAVTNTTTTKDCLTIYQVVQDTAELNLSKRSISDVRPLRGLSNVQHLNLNYNSIISASPLFELTQLSSLSVRGNAISAIGGLTKMANLTQLDLADNRIYDISPVFDLNLIQKLQAHGNRITDNFLTDPRWAKLTSLARRSLNDSEACALEAAILVQKGIVPKEISDYYIGMGMGPMYVRDFDPSSSFDGWANCQVAARFL